GMRSSDSPTPETERVGGLADLAQRITPVSPSMASRGALASLAGRLRPLTAALRRGARCAGNPARFHTSKEVDHEHPRHIARPRSTIAQQCLPTEPVIRRAVGAGPRGLCVRSARAYEPRLHVHLNRPGDRCPRPCWLPAGRSPAGGAGEEPSPCPSPDP